MLIVLVFSGCLSQPTQEAPRVNATLLTDTPTSAPPSMTPLLPTLTATSTASPTDVPTEVPTVTPTPVPLTLIVEQDAICRTVPGLGYGIRPYISVGTGANLSGYVEGDPIWWLAEFSNDGVGTKTACWISDQIVSTSGDVDLLPLLTPPPLPTSSPLPKLDGQITYYYLISEDTGGPIGCGDSLIPVYPGTVKTGDLKTDVRAVLNALFSNHNK